MDVHWIGVEGLSLESNRGGRRADICGVCYAIVFREYRTNHEEWHDRLTRDIINLESPILGG